MTVDTGVNIGFLLLGFFGVSLNFLFQPSILLIIGSAGVIMIVIASLVLKKHSNSYASI